ncbi:MAG: HAD family phosphatase [Anaerolineales bacterium]|nr:HAD family phosphatase [Anaerolineales bacterium]
MTTSTRPPAVRAVVWDLGGVILRTADWARRSQWEDRLGLPRMQLTRLVFESEASRRATLGQVTDDEVWDSVTTALSLDSATGQQLRRDFFADDRIDATLMDFIRRLRARVQVGMITNAWPGVRHALETTFAIADAFDPLVVSAEVGLAKPDPRIYQLMLERLGLGPAEAVFVDDFEDNVAGARWVGMQAVHFTSTPQAMAAVRSLIAHKPEA